MTKQTKKNRPAKPILAWCALCEEDGHVYPGGIIAPDAIPCTLDELVGRAT